MTNCETRPISEGRRFALVSGDIADDFAFDWFEPQHWGSHANQVSVGGRGAAWFVNSPYGHWVLRHFYRGGLPGKLIRNSYLFLGRSRVRSICEYNLLLALLDLGLPVPRPIAAYYERVGFTYRAALILQRLEGVRALMVFQHPTDAPIWREAGKCIRRFHDHGVYHADLNCTNILVEEASGQAHLIDFDRGQLQSDNRPEAAWKQANLARLARSVRKSVNDVSAAERELLLQSLLEGYRDGSP